MQRRTVHLGRMLFLVTFCAALGCGLIAGVFFAFSSFVMPALARLSPVRGVAAMQSINVVVLNRWFLGALLGTAVACLGLGLVSLATWSTVGSRLRFCGCMLYLVGAIGVTVSRNVPRNEALAELRPESAEAAVFWSRFVAEWSAWNHVRAGAALCASALLVLALVRAHGASVRSFGGLLALLGLFGCTANVARPIAPPGSAEPVDRLSMLRIFQGDLAQMRPRADFVAYDVNVSAYADGATKRRLVHVPPGTHARITEDRWELPVGAYLVKTFSFPIDARIPTLGERLIETRFLVRTAEGFEASTYVWNDAQTDAVVSAGDLDVPVSWIDAQGKPHQQTYHVPGTSECESCHAGRPLGWRSRQLDRATTYADGTHDQISHLRALGIVEGALPAHLVLSASAGSASLDARARSYLDANCGHCHGVGGSAEGTGLFWGLEQTIPEKRPDCRATREVDGRDRVLVPGHPKASEFLARMRSSDPDVRMPRGPNQIVDRAGLELLTAWVASLLPVDCAR
jgi:uncharacterized repeat protein (TIGR03806 family)